jgi:acyl dehydratase
VEKLFAKDLSLHQAFDFGTVTLSEDDIINYAKLNDPLEFHTNKEIAEQSIFKGLVSSGTHIFSRFYTSVWVPALGHTVICGLEINSWKFLKPIYADMPVHCKVMVKHLSRNEEKHHVVITWNFEFFNKKKEMVQTADITVMHKL